MPLTKPIPLMEMWGRLKLRLIRVTCFFMPTSQNYFDLHFLRRIAAMKPNTHKSIHQKTENQSYVSKLFWSSLSSKNRRNETQHTQLNTFNNWKSILRLKTILIFILFEESPPFILRNEDRFFHLWKWNEGGPFHPLKWRRVPMSLAITRHSSILWNQWGLICRRSEGGFLDPRQRKEMRLFFEKRKALPSCEAK